MLQDKTIVITGAASGIGRATALLAAKYGAKLALCDLNEEGVAETAQMAHELGAAAASMSVDVAIAEQVEAFMKKASAEFGRIDGAFNNAGVGGTLTRAHMLTEEQWDQCININLKGVWLCIKYEIPHMRGDGGGAIVNMASVAGLLGFPMNSVYAASKHGVIGLTKSAAAEYARNNIRVNAVCPGYTDTPMVSAIDDIRPGLVENTLQAVPMRRLGKPEEIAETVCFLLSDRAPFLTGQAIAIDGGLVNI
ncbi:MAG: SDR family oxidoreductase [Chloroflexi bacterium]|nr:SDR family oxidoreductase [Chloroflexota bacterium]